MTESKFQLADTDEKTEEKPAKKTADKKVVKPKFDAEAEITNLKNLISKLAVMTGQGNMLLEYGIERWEPGKKDMGKFR